MKNYYVLFVGLIISIGISTGVYAQGTETFEAPLPVNSTSWTNAGLTFSSSSANFDTDEFIGAGAGGSDRYIDNIDAPATGSIYSISITAGATLFTMQSMEVYVSSIATGDNPTDDGSMIFRGFNGATEEFAYTKPMGTFPTVFGSTNGFFLLDFATILGDVSNVNIDRIEIELTGSFQYFAVDNFEFDNEVLNSDPPEVQSITVVGTPNSTATSVDFLVTFNENANNVSTDDFSLDATGTTGTIASVSSATGTMITVTVNGISGEGTISIDLNAGTDIEDDLGNTPPPAFTAGEDHFVSRCFQETFESFISGDFVFASNGIGFTTGTANFSVENFVNGGAGGSDQFLSNVSDQGMGKVYSITTSGPELFTIEALDIYLSSELNGANPTDDGSITLEGRLSNSTLYTIMKSTGFPTDFSVNNGFYVVDFATEGGSDHSLTNIDELRITLGGAFQYIALDNFEHCEEITAAAPPIVQSIKLVGNPPANSASVDFEVIFNENAVNVTTDDFSLDLQGTATGAINSISGSGNTYMIGVNTISGEGSLRVDLNAGTDIEDTSGNTPPDPFTDGERFIVSICDVETFESLANGTFSWTTNTVPWTSGAATFAVDEFIGAGAGGSDRYIDNVSSQGTGDVNTIAISDTQMVKMGSMEVYVSSQLNGTNPTDDGTLTVVGKLDGVDQYTIVKSTGFPTIFGSTQGFYMWDFSTEGGVDNSMTEIDEIEMTLSGAFQYLAVDNFKFCMDPPDETEVALAGGTVTITDINGGTSDDDIVLSVVGPNLRITNTVDRFLISGAGVVEVDDNTVDVLLANITNGVVLNTMAGTDAYTQGSAITLPGATNDFTILNIQSFTQTAALDVGGSIDYGVTGPVSLNTTTVGGDLDISAVGNITDSGNTITVAGATTLNTNAAGDINLSGPFNATGMIDADANSIVIFNTPSTPWTLNNIASNTGNINLTNNSNGLTLTGTISANSGIADATIRSGGLGGITQSGGTIVADDLVINTGGQTATVNQAGNDANTLFVGSGSASFTDTDDLSLTGIMSLDQLSVTATDIDFSATATVTLNGPGSNTFMGNLTANAGSQLNQNLGDLSMTGTTLNFNNLQYNGAASTTTNLSGTLITAGSALTFFDLNVTSGDYDTNGNTTFVNGTATFGGTANLIGTGTISGEVAILSGGELAPGNSPGCLSTGSLTLASGSTASFEVLGPTACTQHDQIQVTGTVTINGANFNPLIGYANAPADEIILILNDGVDAVTGTFAGLPQGTAVNFGAFMGFISYVGGDGNDVILAADTTPPMITCPADITQSNDAGTCGAVVTFTVTATDDNPGVTVMSTPASGSTFPVGTTLVTAVATDAAGNTAMCTFNVTVTDDENPVITCPANITASNDPGLCSAVVTYTVTATDNCGATTSNASLNPLKDNTLYQEVPGNSNGAGQLMYVGQNGVGQNDRGLLTFDIAGAIPSGATITAVNLTMTADHPSAANGAQSFTLHRLLEDWGEGASDNGVVPGSGGGGFGAPAVAPDATWDDAMLGTAWAGGAGGNFNPASSASQTVDLNGPYIWSSATLVSDVQDMLDNPGTNFGWAVLGNETTASTTKRFGTRESAIPPVLDITYSTAGGTITLTQTAGLPSGSAFPVGTTTNTFVATDAAGNTDTCSFTVTVDDDEDPVVTCPADITVSNDPGQCGAIVAFMASATDNCPGVTTSSIPASGSFFPVGTTMVTVTAVDAAGNTDVCTFNVTVNDTEPPVITCPADITVNNDPGLCSAVVTFSATATDNCPGTTIAYSPASGSTFPVGTTIVTATATDASGNTDSCTFNVIVVDNEAPTISCPADITVNNDPGVCGAIVNYATPVGSDNCPGSTTAQTAGLPSGATYPVGTTTNTFVVTDAAGNTAMCSFDVTVIDNEPPTIVCAMDVNTTTDAGICGAAVTFADAIAIDNCGVMSVIQTMGPPSGSVFPVGTTTIEYTATDVNGNTNTCTFDITVVDDEPPVAVCMDITIQLDPTGNASITASDVDGGSTDNCNIASLSVSPSTFSCADVGPNNVTLTVTDDSGNMSTCIAVVTVEDVTAPVAVCMDITVELDINGMVTITGADVDGGSNDACGIGSLSVSPDSFTCTDVGDNPVVLTVTDANGNTATCTAIVTVEDNIPPDLVCMDITVELDEFGMAMITPEDVIANNTDACGIFTTAIDIFEFDCDDIGTPITVTVFSMDNNGNLASCTAEVTVVDALGPVVTCPADQTVDPGPGNLFYEVPDYWALGEATAIDNCTDPVVITSQDPVAGTLISDGTYTVTICATDESGNESCCTFELTVESILGNNDNAADFGGIVLYPNPATDFIMLSNPSRIDLNEVAIYDLTGRLVKTIDLREMGTEKSLDISELASATYMFIINSDQGQMSKSIIKE